MSSLLTASTDFTLCMFTDIKIEYDSRGLCHGKDSSQQALFKESENFSGGCGYWCWCLYCN